MKLRKYFLLPACLFLISLCLSAQTALQLKRIDSLMHTASSRGVFNGTLLVAKRGKIIYHKAWGFANASKNQMLTTAMLFDIGSISKVQWN